MTCLACSTTSKPPPIDMPTGAATTGNYSRLPCAARCFESQPESDPGRPYHRGERIRARACKIHPTGKMLRIVVHDQTTHGTLFSTDRESGHRRGSPSNRRRERIRLTVKLDQCDVVQVVPAGNLAVRFRGFMVWRFSLKRITPGGPFDGLPLVDLCPACL